MTAARGAMPSGTKEPLFAWHPAGGKFRLLAGTLLALSAAYGVTYVAIAIGRGWPAGFGDSFALWSWGRFLAEHPAEAIYDPAQLRPVQLLLRMDPGASYPFAYPPSAMPLLWALGQLPGWLSWGALMALSLPFYLWAIIGIPPRPAALAAALAAPTTAIGLVSGQTGFLAAGLLAGGLRLADSNPVAAGILFGLLSYKPQLGFLVPVALVSARLWRTLAAACLTGLALIAVTSLLFGPGIWLSWVTALPVFSRQMAAESSEILHLMPTPLAALLQLGAAPATAQLVQWATTLAAAALVWAMFRAGPTRLASAGLLVATLLATPYAFVYDMPILTGAVIWLVVDRSAAGEPFTTPEMLVLIFAMLSPIALAAGASHFPLAPLSLFLLLATIAWRCLRPRPALGVAFAPAPYEL